MSGVRPVDLLTQIEDEVKRQAAVREWSSREDDAFRTRAFLRLKEEYAARTPVLRAAVERAEEPYQALLISPEWSRTCALIGRGNDMESRTVDVPVEGYFRGSLSFGWTIVLGRRVSFMSHKPMTFMKVEGSLVPIIEWWEAGYSIPQEAGSMYVLLGERMWAYATVLGLCELLGEGQFLNVIQSKHLHRLRPFG